MNHFRSALLRRIPETTNRYAWLHVSIRLAIVGGLLFGLAGWWLIYAFQLLPPRGLGYWLYAFHDHVLLAFKGYFWTRNFPFSLIGWGGLATLGLLILGSLLSDGALVRRAHLGLARRVVRNPLARPGLVAVARGLLKVGLRPTLLQRTVEAELALAEQRLAAGRATPAQLLGLTRLRIELALAGASASQHVEVCLEGLTWWAVTAVCLLLHDQPGAGAAADWRELESLLLDLRRQLPAEAATAWLFHPAGLAAELSSLVELQRRGVPPQAPRSLRLGLELAAAVEARVQRLEAVRGWLENRPLGATPALGEANAARDWALDLPMAWLPAAGCLSLAVALRLAWWLALPPLGLVTLEAMETLTLALDLTEAPPNGEVARLLTGYRQLVAATAQPPHYRLGSRLLAQPPLDQQAEWVRLPNGWEAALPLTDLALARAHGRIIALAAGDDVDFPANQK